MELKMQLSNLLRGSSVTFAEEILSAKVEGKPAALSRNRKSIYFFQNFALLIDFRSKAFNRKVRKAESNCKRSVVASC